MVFDVDYRDEYQGNETTTGLEIAFSDRSEGPYFTDSGLLCIEVDIEVLRDGPSREVWTIQGGAEGFGRIEAVNAAFVHTRDMFLCAGRISENESYSDVTENSYREAMSVQRDLGFPYLVRMWNYVGDINGMNSDNLEVYQDFCRGRARAFDQLGVDGTHMPAATGIGKSDPGIVWYYIASRTPIAQNIENPRQMPAYTYPRRYGPRSPSFSRATRMVQKAESSPVTTLVSGTASIIGHETQHVGDIHGQLDVTFRHLSYFRQPECRYSEVKVYCRHEKDIATVVSRCTDFFGPDTKIMYLKSDVCREELLVEIEGVIKKASARA